MSDQYVCALHDRLRCTECIEMSGLRAELKDAQENMAAVREWMNEPLDETTHHQLRALNAQLRKDVLSQQKRYSECCANEKELERKLVMARDDAFEEAAQACMADAVGYRHLQERARADQDTQSALVHLCEKDAALSLARDIRARKALDGMKEKK